MTRYKKTRAQSQAWEIAPPERSISLPYYPTIVRKERETAIRSISGKRRMKDDSLDFPKGWL